MGKIGNLLEFESILNVNFFRKKLVLVAKFYLEIFTFVLNFYMIFVCLSNFRLITQDEAWPILGYLSSSYRND